MAGDSEYWNGAVSRTRSGGERNRQPGSPRPCSKMAEADESGMRKERRAAPSASWRLIADPALGLPQAPGGIGGNDLRFPAVESVVIIPMAAAASKRIIGDARASEGQSGDEGHNLLQNELLHDCLSVRYNGYGKPSPTRRHASRSAPAVYLGSPLPGGLLYLASPCLELSDRGGAKP